MVTLALVLIMMLGAVPGLQLVFAPHLSLMRCSVEVSKVFKWDVLNGGQRSLEVGIPPSDPSRTAPRGPILSVRGDWFMGGRFYFYVRLGPSLCEA